MKFLSLSFIKIAIILMIISNSLLIAENNDLFNLIECREIHLIHGEKTARDFIDPSSGLEIKFKDTIQNYSNYIGKKYLIDIEFKRKNEEKWIKIILKRRENIKTIVFKEKEFFENMKTYSEDDQINQLFSSDFIYLLEEDKKYFKENIRSSIFINLRQQIMANKSIYFINPEDLVNINNDQIIPNEGDKIRIKIMEYIIDKEKGYYPYLCIQKSVHLEYKKYGFFFMFHIVPAYLYRWGKRVALPSELPGAQTIQEGFLFSILVSFKSNPWNKTNFFKYLIEPLSFNVVVDDISFKKDMNYSLGIAICPIPSFGKIYFLINYNFKEKGFYTGMAIDLLDIYESIKSLYKK